MNNLLHNRNALRITANSHRVLAFWPISSQVKRFLKRSRYVCYCYRQRRRVELQNNVFCYAFLQKPSPVRLVRYVSHRLSYVFFSRVKMDNGWGPSASTRSATSVVLYPYSVPSSSIAFQQEIKFACNDLTAAASCVVLSYTQKSTAKGNIFLQR